MSFVDQISDLKSSPEKLTRELTRIGPPLVTVALVALLAWQLVKLTWLVVPRAKPEAQALATAPVAEPAAPKPNSSADDRVATIVSASLFGEYIPPAEGTKPKIDPENVKETPLKNLSLKGTVAAGDDVNALAIIELDGQQVVYAIGDEVTNGRELHSVEAHRVLLSYAGALEELLLPKLSDTGEATVVRGSSRTTSRRDNARQQAVRNIARNPAKLSDLIRPQPVFSDGKQLGYRVYPGRKREQFTSLGLKPGDLVTSINGTPLDDPARGLEVFRSMNDTTQVSVTVERNGSPTTIVLDTSKLDFGDGDTSR